MEANSIERSCLYYMIGYYGKEEGKSSGDVSELQYDPLVVLDDGGVVEALYVGKREQNENEWEDWFKKQNFAVDFFVQMSMLVKMGRDGEACAERIIEKLIDKKSCIRASMFDVYSAASDGKMHFLDGRSWTMSRQAFNVLEHDNICLQAQIRMAWRRRSRLSRELDMTNDILLIAERLQAFRTAMVLESGAPIYAMSDNRMLLHFLPLFDWDDATLLENALIETLVEIDELTRKQVRLSIVLERQRDILGLPERQKRYRILTTQADSDET